MHVIADVCVIPIGVGVSLSRYISACVAVFRKSGLSPTVHAYGTNVEGEWEILFAAVKQCHETVHSMGAPRISTTVKIGTRTDRTQSIKDKVRSVEEKLTS